MASTTTELNLDVLLSLIFDHPSFLSIVEIANVFTSGLIFIIVIDVHAIQRESLTLA